VVAVSTTLFLALLLLQAKHFVADFVLQTAWQTRSKGTYGHPGGIAHAAIHVAGSALLFLVPGIDATTLLWLLVGEFVVHYHIDWAKEQVMRRFAQTPGVRYWYVFGFDQFLHHATYAVMLYVLFAP
jgi:hypothetical protein